MITWYNTKEWPYLRFGGLLDLTLTVSHRLDKKLYLAKKKDKFCHILTNFVTAYSLNVLFCLN